MFVFGMRLFLDNVRCFFLTFNGPKSTPREILYYSRCFLIKQGTFLLRIVGPLNCPSEKAIIITKWGREFKQLCISLNRNIRPLPHCRALIIYILAYVMMIKWLFTNHSFTEWLSSGPCDPSRMHLNYSATNPWVMLV